MSMAGNDEKILAEAVKIIRKNVGDDCKIFLFGSRADGTAHGRSDYDIGVLLGDQKIPQMAMVKIKDELENLYTLFSVDVVDFNDVSKNFYDVAMKNIINL